MGSSRQIIADCLPSLYRLGSCWHLLAVELFIHSTHGKTQVYISNCLSWDWIWFDLSLRNARSLCPASILPDNLARCGMTQMFALKNIVVMCSAIQYTVQELRWKVMNWRQGCLQASQGLNLLLRVRIVEYTRYKFDIWLCSAVSYVSHWQSLN